MTRYIDADGLKLTLRFVREDNPHKVIGAMIDYFEEIVDCQPTVDAVPVRHGKWICGNEFHWYTASCSRCGYKRTTDIKATNWNLWKYCPMCGARMDAERKEE